MKIIRSGSLPSVQGPEAWFTGSVRIDAPFQATEPAKVGGATVTFEPGARTAWHTHPLGQTLIVTQGRGWLQEWGKEAEPLNQGGYRLDPTRREALARRKRADGDDPYRHRRSGRRESGGVAGEGHRRAVSERVVWRFVNKLLTL